MNRFLSLAAIAFVFVATATADPPLAPLPSTAAPALVGSAPMAAPAPVLSSVPPPRVDNTLIAPQRRMGFFARIRARNTAPALASSPAFTTMPAATVSPATGVPATMPTTPAPMPMKGSTSSATPTVTGEEIVQTSGTTPMPMTTGTPMSTGTVPMTTNPNMMYGPMTTGSVMMAGGMMTTPEMVATPATTKRMGLLARIRARRGN